jgi:hypothetical protein
VLASSQCRNHILLLHAVQVLQLDSYQFASIVVYLVHYSTNELTLSMCACCLMQTVVVYCIVVATLKHPLRACCRCSASTCIQCCSHSLLLSCIMRVTCALCMSNAHLLHVVEVVFPHTVMQNQFENHALAARN